MRLISLPELVEEVRKPVYVGFFISLAINVLFLSGPLFMLQVYDRVIPSQSIATLQALIILVLVLYTIQASLETTRSKLFSGIGAYIDAKLAKEVFFANIHNSLKKNTLSHGNIFKDLEQYQNFFSSGGFSSMLDVIWVPVYIIILYILHPYFGIFSTIGLMLLALITWRTNKRVWPLQDKSVELNSQAFQLISQAGREAETVHAMGMRKNLYLRWASIKEGMIANQLETSNTSINYSGLGKFVRLNLQSLGLAVGAWLIIDGELSSGVLIAASILQGRALAPIEQAIAQWKNYTTFYQSYHHLNSLLASNKEEIEKQFILPNPTSTIDVDNLDITPPSRTEPTVKGINFKLEAGDALGIIGSSGSGKSSLARVLTGTWIQSKGEIRFDGAEISQWAADNIGDFIGYLPQRVELFPGTISQNISRFDPDVINSDVLAAANMASVDKLIRQFPDGYNTLIKNNGDILSAGQRQRIALARALYKKPFLLVLDEPNSGLDPEGENALFQAIGDARKRGGIVILITHRMNALKSTNKLLALKDGYQHSFGPIDDVLKIVKN